MVYFSMEMYSGKDILHNYVRRIFSEIKSVFLFDFTSSRQKTRFLHQEPKRYLQKYQT